MVLWCSSALVLWLCGSLALCTATGLASSTLRVSAWVRLRHTCGTSVGIIVLSVGAEKGVWCSNTPTPAVPVIYHESDMNRGSPFALNPMAGGGGRGVNGG